MQIENVESSCSLSRGCTDIFAQDPSKRASEVLREQGLSDEDLEYLKTEFEERAGSLESANKHDCARFLKCMQKVPWTDSLMGLA